MPDGLLNDRRAPFNLEAEQAVLGALLMNNVALDDVSRLKPDHFYEPVHGRLFEAISSVVQAGGLANPVTLKQAFERDGVLEQIGGTSYLADLAAASVGAMAVPHYAHVIRDTYQRRRALQIVGDLEDAAQRAALDAWPAELERCRLALEDDVAETAKGAIASAESVAGVLREAEAARSRGSGLAGLATGLQQIDRLTGGLMAGNLIILGGRPGSMKTGTALQVAANVADRAGAVLFVSLEMTDQELARRALAMASRIPHQQIMTGAFNEADLEDMHRAAAHIRKRPLFVDDECSSVGMIRAAARRLQRRHGLALIVVDYIQLMDGPGRDLREQVTHNSRALKLLAKQLEVPVLALAQLNRENEKRQGDQRPRKEDLRESGSLEQDADSVWLTYREAAYLERKMRKLKGLPKRTPAEDEELTELEADHSTIKHRLEIIVDKNRHGREDSVMLWADLATNRVLDGQPR